MRILTKFEIRRSGHNTIAVATVLLEMGLVEMQNLETKFNLESPAGVVGITATCEDGKAVSISLLNIPAFVFHLDALIDVPTLGKLSVDVAWGGMIYALADADSLGIALVPGNGK